MQSDLIGGFKLLTSESNWERVKPEAGFGGHCESHDLQFKHHEHEGWRLKHILEVNCQEQ